MKILETQSAHLTHYEVLSHLESLRRRHTATAQKRGSSAAMKSGNMETVMKEVVDYLHRRPSPLASTNTYDTNTIRNLFTALQPFDLTKAELLMIINLRPSNLTILDTIIEEMDERFTEAEQEEILRLVGEVLGLDEDSEINGNYEEEEEEVNEEMQDVVEATGDGTWRS
ncbi:MAG: hypothetical protein M1837_003721 [Sclerophora amabilis]|nr:MAG: hypothetical protein M1837_003721 [Sclerophora amabilis]